MKTIKKCQMYDITNVAENIITVSYNPESTGVIIGT